MLVKARELKEFKGIREIKGSTGIIGPGGLNGISVCMQPYLFGRYQFPFPVCRVPGIVCKFESAIYWYPGTFYRN